MATPLVHFCGIHFEHFHFHLNLKICFLSSINLEKVFAHFFSFGFVMRGNCYIKAEIYIATIEVAIAIMTTKMWFFGMQSWVQDYISPQKLQILGLVEEVAL